MSVNNRGHWPYTVVPGDILRDRNGTERVVRHATQGASGYTTSVSFTILRRSWTDRPLTTLGYVDLAARGFVPTGQRQTTMTLLDKRINTAALNHNNRRLHAADVIGVTR